jgi:hypothetical protein
MSGAGYFRAWVLPIVDVLAALLALSGLLPIAGGLPGIASQGQPVMDSLWFTVNLGGALLLLAGGLKLLLRKGSLHLFILLYSVSIGVLGILRLQIAGFPHLISGWLLMAFFVAGLLLLLHRPWPWTVMGAVWCALLLGFWSIGGVISFLSTETQQLSFFLPLQIVAFLLTLVLLVLLVLNRRDPERPA